MSGPISTERLFSMPCFGGLRLFRKYIAGHPDLAIPDLLALIDSVEADARSLDMEAAVYLSEIVEKDCPLDGPAFYQTCIRGVLLKHQPVWASYMREGRKRFVKNLNPNDQNVFSAAGLMENPMPLQVVTWWDSISGYARLLIDQEKMEQARAAEILTLEHERNRLKTLGINREPEWPGFDDNFAGYDILSYDHGPDGIQNKLIEVKSTIASPLRFILTRHEWNKAKRAGDSYGFHVWDMSPDPPVLFEHTVADIAPHIPADSGKGRWKSTEVRVHTHQTIR